MNRGWVTTYIVDRYRFRPGPETIKALAEQFELTEACVYARLWRAGVLRDSKAMYHTDEAIIATYRRLGAVTPTAQALGATFYTVKDVLRRAGITPVMSPKPLKVPLAKVAATIKTLRPDVEWKGIAQRLGVSTSVLYEYRKRLQVGA